MSGNGAGRFCPHSDGSGAKSAPQAEALHFQRILSQQGKGMVPAGLRKPRRLVSAGVRIGAMRPVSGAFPLVIGSYLRTQNRYALLLEIL